MKRRKSAKESTEPSGVKTPHELPFSDSVGYQIRMTHRALQRFLHLKIEPFGITTGIWYFLRALWNENGLTQRELSRRVGTMEPTTMAALQIMEKRGLVKRVRSRKDRRKIHVHLTSKGSELRKKLVPLARDVVATAVQGMDEDEVRQLLEALKEVQKNLFATVSQFEEIVG